MASASVAKANAYMELISGTSTVQIMPGAAMNTVVHSGSYSLTFSDQVGNSADFIGTVGSWTLDISSGTSSGDINIQLQNTSTGSAVTKGLEIIYSSGTYSLNGQYLDGAAETGPNTLSSTVQGYAGGSLYTGSGSMGTALATATTAPGYTPAVTAATGFTLLPNKPGTQESTLPITLNGSYAITEVINIAAPSSPGHYQYVAATASFNSVPVPDGGMTASMIGSALLGLVGLRSKFCSKRS